MLRNHFISIALFFSVISLFSCLEESNGGFILEPEADEGYYNVDSRLWDYYKSFEEEAEKRGIKINLQNAQITGEIDNIHDNNVIGTCQYGRYSNNHVTIDKAFWNRSGVLGKEFVVFHELGHCFLLRGHKEDSTSEGLCVSLMRSGTGRCIDAYNSRNREYYLNELFSIKGD